MMSTIRSFSASLDTVNTAWHEGKAHYHFENTVIDLQTSGEWSDASIARPKEERHPAHSMICRKHPQRPELHEES